MFRKEQVLSAEFLLWGQEMLPKCLYLSTKPYGVTPQNTVVSVFTIGNRSRTD
jgi:hypothetical protein